MSTESADRRVRVARGVAAASVASIVALASHVAGGGTVPPLVVLTAVVFSWPFGVLLIGRRPALVRQTVVIGFAQVVMHLLATLASQPAASVAVRPDGVGMTGMGVQPDAVAGPAADMPGMTAPTPAMWAMHVAAAIITVAAWRHGERVAASVADRIAVTVLRAIGVVVRAHAAAAAPAPVPPAGPRSRRDRVASSPAPLRGPPLLVD